MILLVVNTPSQIDLIEGVSDLTQVGIYLGSKVFDSIYDIMKVLRRVALNARRGYIWCILPNMRYYRKERGNYSACSFVEG